MTWVGSFKKKWLWSHAMLKNNGRAEGGAVQRFILKKEAGGKPKKVPK
jgi:hypothetical protein